MMNPAVIERALSFFRDEEIIKCREVTQKQILEALTPQETQILAKLPCGLPMKIMDYMKIPRE